jgi:histidinol-phosphate aminotransferase
MAEVLLRPRVAVAQATPYRPPLSGRAGLLLDFNESGAGPSPVVLARLRELGAERLCRYPDREPGERTVAEFLDLSPEQVLLTNGSDEAIALLCRAYLAPGDQALVLAPGFAMYEHEAACCGAKVARVAAGARFAFPLAGLLASLTPATRLVAIANPNNPTGALAAPADLLRLAEAAPQAAVLIDEAYIEFAAHGSLVGEIGRLPNLFVTRTFSKAYGLAGLRLGTLLGDAAQLGALRTLAGPYNVNALALDCLPVALADAAYLRRCVAEVRAGRRLLRAELRRYGIRTFRSAANFVLADLGAQAAAFVAAMARRGVLVRDRSTDPACPGCVRVTVGTAEQMLGALAAIDASLAEIGLGEGVAP